MPSTLPSPHATLFASLWRTCEARFALPLSPIHGPDHWRRVERLGLWLAEGNASDALLVRAFAPLHDCCRQSEGHDPDHGKRAAEWAARWFHEQADGRALAAVLGMERIKALLFAIYHHNGGTVAPGAAGLLFDSDRLDLVRLKIKPDARLLSTAKARTPAAYFFALAGLSEVRPSGAATAAHKALTAGARGTRRLVVPDVPSQPAAVPNPDTMLYHFTFGARWPSIARHGLRPAGSRANQKRFSNSHPGCVYLSKGHWYYGFAREGGETLILRVRLGDLEPSRLAPDDDYLRERVLNHDAWLTYSQEQRARVLENTSAQIWELMDERRAEWPHCWARTGTLAYLGTIAPSQFSAAVVIRKEGNDACFQIGCEEGLVGAWREAEKIAGGDTSHPQCVRARRRFQDRELALAFDFSREIPGIERYDRAAIGRLQRAASGA